jgi:hypothetical protein
MNIYSQKGWKRERNHEAPLFASPWIALFLVLRKEWSQPRTAR